MCAWDESDTVGYIKIILRIHTFEDPIFLIRIRISPLWVWSNLHHFGPS